MSQLREILLRAQRDYAFFTAMRMDPRTALEPYRLLEHEFDALIASGAALIGFLATNARRDVVHIIADDPDGPAPETLSPGVPITVPVSLSLGPPTPTVSLNPGPNPNPNPNPNPVNPIVIPHDYVNVLARWSEETVADLRSRSDVSLAIAAIHGAERADRLNAVRTLMEML